MKNKIIIFLGILFFIGIYVDACNMNLILDGQSIDLNNYFAYWQNQNLSQGICQNINNITNTTYISCCAIQTPAGHNYARLTTDGKQLQNSITNNNFSIEYNLNKSITIGNLFVGLNNGSDFFLVDAYNLSNQETYFISATYNRDSFTPKTNFYCGNTLKLECSTINAQYISYVNIYRLYGDTKVYLNITGDPGYSCITSCDINYLSNFEQYYLRSDVFVFNDLNVAPVCFNVVNFKNKGEEILTARVKLINNKNETLNNCTVSNNGIYTGQGFSPISSNTNNYGITSFLNYYPDCQYTISGFEYLGGLYLECQNYTSISTFIEVDSNTTGGIFTYDMGGCLVNNPDCFYVYDSQNGALIPGATIKLTYSNGSYETYNTGSSGKYCQFYNPVQNVNINISKTGYFDLQSSTQVGNGNNIPFNLEKYSNICLYFVGFNNSEIPIPLNASYHIYSNYFNSYGQNYNYCFILDKIEPKIIYETITYPGYDTRIDSFIVNPGNQDIYIELYPSTNNTNFEKYSIYVNVSDCNSKQTLNNAKMELTCVYSFGGKKYNNANPYTFNNITLHDSCTLITSMNGYKNGKVLIGGINNNITINTCIDQSNSNKISVYFHVFNNFPIYNNVNDVSINLHCDGYTDSQCNTDNNGNCNIDNIDKNAKCTYQASKNGYVPKKETINNLINTIEIELKNELNGACKVFGTVTYENGSIAKNYPVNIVDVDGNIVGTTVTNDKGIYSFKADCKTNYILDFNNVILESFIIEGSEGSEKQINAIIPLVQKQDYTTSLNFILTAIKFALLIIAMIIVMFFLVIFAMLAKKGIDALD